MKLRRSEVLVDLAAIQHNYHYLKSQAPGSKGIAVIKANAYGHGAVKVAQALSTPKVTADAFAVATIAEGIELRQAKINQKIIILGGFNTQDEYLLAIKHQLDCVIHSDYQIEMLKHQNEINLWLKVDTGMGRLGFNLTQVKEVLQKIKDYSNIKLMTHFSSADDINDVKTQQQIEALKSLNINHLEWSLTNSAGTLNPKIEHGSWLRFGISLYGINPYLYQSENQQTELKPAMQFSSYLISINQHKKGDSIGYGSSYQCLEDCEVGVIGVGYADGYPRHIKENTQVMINGTLVPVIGRVSMDMITINLSKVETAKIGDKVILWGQNPTAETIAYQAETIAYELCCNAGAHANLEYQ